MSPKNPSDTTVANGHGSQHKNGSAKKEVVSRDYLRDRHAVDKEWNCLDHILWVNVLYFVGMHVGTVLGLYLAFTSAKYLTLLFAVVVYTLSLFGITAGVHRLWSHRAYKAKLPLRVFLAFCNSMAYQNSIFVWARDHRVHHKYSETNADPVNIERGFFFAHCGWLMCKKHPDVAEYGLRVDMSDVMADPVVYYQHKYYLPSVLLVCFLMPTLVPWYFWGETLWNAYWVATIARYTLSLNSTWLVNSAAHMFGNRPYDSKIAPAENKSVAFLTLGEGYHNYHHTFPWDYSTSEWGWNINLTTFVLDQFAKIGWAYDRRTASKEMIKNRKARTGPAAANGHYQPVELEY